MRWITNCGGKELARLHYDKIPGPPKPSEACSVEDLERMGYWGVYAPEEGRRSSGSRPNTT